QARQSYGAAARPDRRQFLRTRHAGHNRRRDGAVALRGGLRRLQYHVPLCARGPRGLRRQGGSRAAGRGLLRREYEGKTLRENLGLPRPENQFFSASKERPEVAPAPTRTAEVARSVWE